METPVSRAVKILDAARTEMKSECARYLEAAEALLLDLAAHSTNGEKSFLAGLRNRLEQDRKNLMGMDEPEKPTPVDEQAEPEPETESVGAG